MPINAEIKVCHISRMGRLELQTWCIDGARRPVSPTNAVTSKIKGQGHMVRLTVVAPQVENEKSQKHQNW